MSTMKLQLEQYPRRIAIILAIAAGLFTLLAATAQILDKEELDEPLSRIARQFDPDEEANVFNWYQSATLLCCAAALAVTAGIARGSDGRFVNHWRGLALLLLFAAIDETAQIHENLFSSGDSSGRWYLWILLYVGVLALIGLAYVRFFFRLPRSVRWGWVIAAAVYLGGAVGVELLDGYYAEAVGTDNLVYRMIAVVSEAMEMFGVVLFLHAQLSYLASRIAEVRVVFAGETNPQA